MFSGKIDIVPERIVKNEDNPAVTDGVFLCYSGRKVIAFETVRAENAGVFKNSLHEFLNTPCGICWIRALF